MKDAEDFDAFVRARWSATARLAYALTLDRQKAEDLAQEAFTKLWFHWRKLSTGGSPEAYLRKIVTTTFLSGRRRRWIGERPTAAPPDTAIASASAEVDERLVLRQAMARLSPRQRAAVYLRYAEDLPERAVVRRTAGTIMTAAAATAAVAMSGPLLGSGGHEPQVAGFAPPPVSTAPSSPQPSGNSTTVMPPPWSSERFTKLPDANAYRPHAYYIAKGTLPTESFGVLAFSRQGCIVTDEGPANSFGRIYVCFEDWKPGQRSAFFAAPAHSKEKSSQLLDFTLVVGAVSTDARKVRVTTAGKTYTTDAVGTPATDQLRFFAVLVPHKDAKIAAVSPVNATGGLAAAPANPPKHQPCGSDCGTATPAK